MSCPRTDTDAAAYHDGELDLTASLAFEAHLAECTDCARAAAGLDALRTAIGGGDLRFRPTPAQTRRLRAAVAPSTPRLAVGRLQAIAALLLVAVAGWSLGRFTARPGPDLADDVVAGHVRALLAGRPAEVASTDQHTVRPWFAGKLDFAPSVVDLASQGFPLLGGRLDYVGHRSVATLVYGADRHLISLSTWPDAAAPGTARPTAAERQGFHVVHWSQGGMTYWAVSDAGEERLRRLAGLLAGEAGRAP